MAFPVMYYNPEHLVGVLPLTPLGTNSTMFTQCCYVAICDDEPNCLGCGRKIRGWDAETRYERGRIRWRYATAHWKRRSK